MPKQLTERIIDTAEGTINRTGQTVSSGSGSSSTGIADHTHTAVVGEGGTLDINNILGSGTEGQVVYHTGSTWAVATPIIEDGYWLADDGILIIDDL